MSKQLSREEEIDLAYKQLAKEKDAEKDKAWAEREAPVASEPSLFDLAKR